uniref:Uncharacterized protein n=1 Tax=Candidatus Methanophaga sp. ANME-1 ERB7 TaxID=2759913 RepID=A0A7G9ZBJ7_9EURY|nr:hypothetical protein LCMFKOLL_00027 [Methanosarcinales archaeon ANME-1 ERB7]
MTNNNNSLDILKMEYQSCRNKLDDLDNFLKDLRLKGITIVTGFITGNGLLLKFECLDLTILVSFVTIMLTLNLWVYDHKYNMFLVGTAERAQQIENRLQVEINGSEEGVKMLTNKLSEVYRTLPAHIAITAPVTYSLLGFIELGIFLYSFFLKGDLWLLIVASIVSIFFIYIIFHLWYLRKKAEPWFKWPTLPKLFGRKK